MARAVTNNKPVLLMSRLLGCDLVRSFSASLERRNTSDRLQGLEMGDVTATTEIITLRELSALKVSNKVLSLEIRKMY